MNSLKKLSPFQIIIIVVFVLLAFGGLYLFANFTGNNAANKIGAVVIWGTLPETVMTQELGTLSNVDNSYTKVTYVQIPAASFDADLANAIASGNSPDLILISQEQLLTEENKLSIIPFSSISQRSFIDTYLPENEMYLTANGTYGIPFVLDPLVLYYNKTILASAGVPLPPTTWEKVTGLTPPLTRLNPDQSIAQSTVSFGLYNNVENARAILSLLLLQSGSTITETSSIGVRSTLARDDQNASGASSATSALNFYTQFADPSRTVYSWNANFGSALQTFIAGNLAFYLGYASQEASLKAQNPNLNFDMAQIPQPQTASSATDYGLAYAFAIPKASKNPSGSFATALALGGNSVLPAAAHALSMAPSQRALLTVSPTDTFEPIYYPEALVARGWLSPAPATTDAIFSAMISNITSGRYQTHEAIPVADQALNAALPSSP
ncbi:extracellular solute-binding protein [Patescibacteria group bacterium]|nr:extracellular solute-binding protein [Patescibacteria group bacterium]